MCKITFETWADTPITHDKVSTDISGVVVTKASSKQFLHTNVNIPSRKNVLSQAVILLRVIALI